MVILMTCGFVTCELMSCGLMNCGFMTCELTEAQYELKSKGARYEGGPPMSIDRSRASPTALIYRAVNCLSCLSLDVVLSNLGLKMKLRVIHQPGGGYPSFAMDASLILVEVEE